MRVVLLGDSIFGHWDFDGFPVEHEFLNLGIGGDTTTQIRARVPNVLTMAPHVTFVLGGSNDVRRRHWPRCVAWRVLTAVNALSASGTRVIVCTIPPQGFRQRASIEAVNARLVSSGVECADFNSVLSDHAGLMRSDFSSDGVHPNRDGYAAMRRVVCEVLSQAPS